MTTVFNKTKNISLKHPTYSGLLLRAQFFATPKNSLQQNCKVCETELPQEFLVMLYSLENISLPAENFCEASLNSQKFWTS